MTIAELIKILSPHGVSAWQKVETYNHGLRYHLTGPNVAIGQKVFGIATVSVDPDEIGVIKRLVVTEEAWKKIIEIEIRRHYQIPEVIEEGK